ncbi:MAG: prephenate dehydrogenase [Kiritimatiellia bacterium]
MSRVRQVAIIGLGLMGGSLGMALRGRPGLRVTGYARREETRGEALARGVVDEVFADPAEAAAGAQLVIICTPVNLIAELAEACASGLEAGAVVTDVGSSKAEIVARLDGFFSSSAAHFVGSHPVAGSERQGLAAARADLYRHAVVALTPTEATDAGAVVLVTEFWRSLAARVFCLAPEEHDRLLAATSHLPHLMAAVLAATVGRWPAEQAGRFCGTGFWDTTRVAEGDPALWHDIVQTNRAAVLGALRAFQQQLACMTDAVENNDFNLVRDMLSDARDRRRALEAQRS